MPNITQRIFYIVNYVFQYLYVIVIIIAMDELSEGQCEKLDKILNMFGDEDQLDADKVLAIEPNDRKASALLDLLVKKGFIIRVGETEERNLPLIINLEPAAYLFIENGGFMAIFKKRQTETATIVNIHNNGHNNVINTGNHSSVAAEFSKKVDADKTELGPHLEAELIYLDSGRRNTAYSTKNPIETDENGQSYYNLGFAIKPIIHWRLKWNYWLTVHNNSSYPAYNVKIDFISGQQFTNLTKLDKINNLQPGGNFRLDARYESYIESTSVEADEILSPRIPKALNGLCLQITYLDERRKNHITIITIDGQEVINIKK